MTDTTEIQSGAPAEDARAHNKNLIFAALAEVGIPQRHRRLRRQRR